MTVGLGEKAGLGAKRLILAKAVRVGRPEPEGREDFEPPESVVAQAVRAVRAVPGHPRHQSKDPPKRRRQSPVLERRIAEVPR